MNISVIVPVLNEEKSIAATLQAWRACNLTKPSLSTAAARTERREIAAEFGVKVIPSERGRARQMNRGAREASGDVLLFLHADTRLPSTAFSDIAGAMGDPRYVGGRFDVELDGKHWLLPLVGRLISYRSRLSKVATGDQAQFARREVFQRMGGFADIPLMEDIAFCRTLKRLGEVACLRSRVVTSARRWEVDGVWRTIFRMWTLKLLYLTGVSPARLKQFYADTR